MDPKNFEIPAEMRKFAEQSVDQARKAFESFIDAAQQAASDIEGRANVARAGAKDVGEKAMVFAQHNIASSFEFAQQLVRARDVQEVLKLQADYIRSQIEALNQQAKELGETAGKAAMDSAKPKF
ncbi:MAG: phasin [Pseudorhodoplanes sp.]|nr:MAG: phasin [Pseudorhodoplanes sp.]